MTTKSSRIFFFSTRGERITTLIKQMEFEDILLFCERNKTNMQQRNKNISVVNLLLASKYATFA